jgi:hypothetical protein
MDTQSPAYKSIEETYKLNLPNVISSRRNMHNKCITFTMDVQTMQNVGLTLPAQSQLHRFYVSKSDMSAPHQDCFSLAISAFEGSKATAVATSAAGYFNFKINTTVAPFPYLGQSKFVTLTVDIDIKS